MSDRRDIFTWLILASVFFIPLQLPVGATSRLSLADFFVVLASPLLLLRFHVAPRAVLIAPLLFPLVMLYGALLGGLVNGQVLAHAMIAKVLGSMVLIFLLLSWLQVAQESERGIFDLMKAFLLGSVVFSLIGLVEFYAGVSIITVRFIESRFSGGYFDPNHYGALTGVGLVFIAALGRDIFRRDSSIFIVGGILGVGLLLCISRGAWVATVFGILVVVIMRPIKIKAPVIALAILVVIGVLLSGVLEHLSQDIHDRPDNASHRLTLIKEGLRLFKEGHFVGIGLSVFLEKNEIIIHNSVVWMLVEMGVVGAIAYLLFITEPVVRLMRLRFRHHRMGGHRGDQIARISAALLGAHLLMTVASQLVEATYQRQWWLVFALTAGLLTRNTVSSSRKFSTNAFKAKKSGINWSHPQWPKLKWPAPWRALSNTIIQKSRINSIRFFRTRTTDSTQNANSLKDTSVTDPTVLLDLSIYDSILSKQETHHTENSSTSSDSHGSAEDDAATERSTNTDTETQSLPVQTMEQLGSTDEASESHSNLAEDDAATEGSTNADTETQFLSVQAMEYLGSVDEASESHSNLAEDDAATERSTNTDTETQSLPVQTMEQLGSTDEASESHSNLAEDDTATEGSTNADTGTQFLPVQTVESPGNTDEASDSHRSLAEDDDVIEDAIDADTKTQYLPIADAFPINTDQTAQEADQSGSPSIPDSTVIPVDGDFVAEAKSNTDDESDTDDQLNTEGETQLLSASDSTPTDHSDKETRAPDSAVTPTDNKVAAEIETETNVDDSAQDWPIADSVSMDNDQSIQEKTQSQNASDTVKATDVLEEGSGTTRIHHTLDYDIEEIQGIEKQDIQRLREIDIDSTLQLLTQADASDSTTEISHHVDKQEALVQTWVGMADLIRIPGIRGQFAELITMCGVLSVKQLATQDAYTLTEKISDAFEITTEKLQGAAQENHYRAKPSLDMVTVWIDAANTLIGTQPGNTSIPDTETVLAEDDITADKATNTEAETQHFLTAHSALMNNEQAEQETRSPDNIHETSTPATELNLEEDGMVTAWIDAANQLMDNQPDNTPTPNTETALAKDDITTNKTTHIDTETLRISTANPTLMNNDPIGQEANLSDKVHESPTPDTESSFTKEAITLKTETHADPSPSVSDLTSIDNDQAKHETDFPDNSFMPDPAVFPIHNNASTPKETNTETERQELPFVESFMMNNKSAEQETHHRDNTTDTAIPAVAMIITEDVGEKEIDLRDYAIEEITGIETRYSQRLRAINIETTHQLLKQARTPAIAAEIGHQINAKESLVQTWISMADLMQIPGVRGKFAEQIVLSGIASVAQLATQDPHLLLEKLSSTHESSTKDLMVTSKKDHFYARPSIDMLAVWIDAAKKLDNEA